MRWSPKFTRRRRANFRERIAGFALIIDRTWKREVDMTYLDQDQTRHAGVGSLVLRIAAILAILAFGWFALTVGSEDSTGRPEIVPEPMVSTS
jgi:hypothetical protein